jgi:hypothetical protein
MWQLKSNNEASVSAFATVTITYIPQSVEIITVADLLPAQIHRLSTLWIKK